MLESDNVEIDTGKITIGGARLVIKMTSTGYYWIDAVGPGGKPDITEDRFTNTREALVAVDRYCFENEGTLNKKAAMAEGIARRKKAHEEKE